MLKFGYWNTNKKDHEHIASYIIDLLYSENLDVLFLSEFSFSPQLFANNYLPNEYCILDHPGVCTKVLAISKRGLDLFIANEEDRFLVLSSRSLNVSVVGLHLPDNCNDNNSQIKRGNCLSNILEAINTIKNIYDVFVGDFNCMPYSNELTTIYGLHCVLFKKEAKTRTGGRKKHYNPMLLLLNEENQMYGSFKYSSDSCPLYWYAFDQVIVSDNLCNKIFNIRYLKTINGKSLMSRNGSKPRVSDHLPLVFELDL